MPPLPIKSEPPKQEEKTPVKQNVQLEADTEIELEPKDDFKDAEDVEITKSNFSVIERDLLVINPVEGIKKNSDDTHTLEWGRERNSGFVIGRVMSPSPMFFTADGHSVHLEDTARGASIIIAGPDTKNELMDRNVYLWAIGKAINKAFNAHIWTTVSEPGSYDKVWSNPSILKIVPASFAHIKNAKGFIAHSPFTFYFRRHDEFSPQNFLFENSVYGPNNGDFYLLTVLRLAYVMGFRNVYLTGMSVSDRVKDIMKIINPMFERNKFHVHDIDCGLSIKKADIGTAMSACIL